MFGASEPYRMLAGRPDVLVFATPPLEHELEVTGSVTVRLWISSDGLDTDSTAKLIDVSPPNDDYPEGFAMNLTEGVLRVRYRDSWERPSPNGAGRDPRDHHRAVSDQSVHRGHRLRLDISSSNFPHFDVNPNSGEPEGAMEHPRTKLRQLGGEDSLNAKCGCEVRDVEGGVAVGGPDRRWFGAGRVGGGRLGQFC